MRFHWHFFSWTFWRCNPTSSFPFFFSFPYSDDLCGPFIPPWHPVPYVFNESCMHFWLARLWNEMHAATKIECRFSYGYVLLGWFPQLHSTCVDNVIVCWLSILIGIFLIALRFPLFSSVFKTIFDRDSRHVDCLLKIKSRHLYRPLDWFALFLVYVFHVNFCLKFFIFFFSFIYFLLHLMT